jgi:Domain of unknown function (DUF4190)
MSSPFPPGNPNPFQQPQGPSPFGGPGGSFGPYSPATGFPPTGPQFGYQPQPSRQLSILAVFSLIAGGFAWLACCCSPVMLPMSIVSVVLGHVALVNIHRAQGRVTGLPLAIVGLVLGYPAILLSSVMLVLPFTGIMEKAKRQADEAAARPPQTAKEALQRVESQIATAKEGVAHGNSPAAKDIAQKFSQRMHALREEQFTKARPGISLSGGNFITWCELRPGQCALVTHVPNYRNFDGEAKKALADLAWQAAEESVAGTLPEGDRLAVGMKGVLLYGTVMTGTVVAPDRADEGRKERDDNEALLYPFFEPLPEEATEPMIDLGPAGAPQSPKIEVKKP